MRRNPRMYDRKDGIEDDKKERLGKSRRPAHIKKLLLLVVVCLLWHSIPSSHRKLYAKHVIHHTPIFLSIETDNMAWIHSALDEIVAAAGSELPLYRIYYDTTVTPHRIQHACRHRRLHCHSLGHSQTSTTTALAHVEHFCSIQPQQTLALLRIDNTTNPIHQRHWQDAALHCLAHLTSNSNNNNQCDVCGLHVETNPYWNYPHTMFATTCQHVSRLIPVEGLQETHYQSLQHLMLLKLRRLLQIDHYETLQADVIPHWIASHPATQPCSMTSNYTHWTGDTARSLLDFQFTPRPTQPLPTTTLRNMHGASGWLARWTDWYPTANLSGVDKQWWWNILPNGTYWEQAIDLYGLQAQSVVGLQQEYGQAVEPRRTSFDATPAPFDFTSHHSHAIFYNIWVANAVEQEHALNRVTEQVQILKNSGTQPLPVIYYNLLGDDLDMASVCAEHGLECHELAHYPDRTEGNVLEHLHEYCQLRPTSSVTYWTSTVGDVRGNYTHEDAKVWWRHATKASVSPLCVVNADTCNVCGLSFYTVPYLFFPGEMFKADCSYVNQLMNPRTYEVQQTETATSAMVETIRNRLTMTLFAQQADFLGVDEFALHHWIASHPYLKPCDVAQQVAPYWITERALTQFQYGPAPRQEGVPLGYPHRPYWDAELRKLRPYARREYVYLAGLLLRWQRLYGQVPPAASWVYRWFPDGAGVTPDWETMVAPYVNASAPVAVLQ